MRLSLVTGPTDDPITDDEVIAQRRLQPGPPDIEYIKTLIAAATQHVEHMTGRQLMTATWKLNLDCFPSRRAPIELSHPPLQSVTSVTYLDPAGAPQTWANTEYVVDAPQGPRALEGRLYPALNVEYPATASRQDAVTIEYKAGYGTQPNVPSDLKNAILLLVGHWYENREAVITGTIVTEMKLAVESLLMPFSRLSNALR